MIEAEPTPLENANYAMLISSEWTNLVKANEPQLVQDASKATNIGGKMQDNLNKMLNTFTVTDQFGESTITQNIVGLQLALPIETTVDLQAQPEELTGVSFTDENDQPVDMNIANTNSKFTINYTDAVTTGGDATLDYTLSIPGMEDITESITKPVQAFDSTAGTIQFKLEKLNVFMTLTLSQDGSLTDQEFDVNVFKKPETEGEKVLALEYAMANIEGYDVDYIVYTDHYLGQFIDDITLDNKTDIAQANGVNFDAISSITETFASETDVDEFYRINDPVVRLADFAIQNSTDAKRCVVVAPAMPMDNIMYSSIKKQLEKLENYKNNEEVSKIFEVLGQNLVLSAIMKKDISGALYTDIFTPLSKILNRSFLDSYYNIMIDGTDIQNIVPNKFKDRFYNTGVIFASKKGENVVIPALRTMNFTNMTSVRTIKLINYVLNEAKNKQDAFLGRPSNPINISQIRENIQTIVDKLVTAGAIKAGNVYTKASTVGTSIGRVQVKISIIDYFEIKQIDIEATYSKSLPDNQ